MEFNENITDSELEKELVKLISENPEKFTIELFKKILERKSFFKSMMTYEFFRKIVAFNKDFIDELRKRAIKNKKSFSGKKIGDFIILEIRICDYYNWGRYYDGHCYIGFKDGELGILEVFDVIGREVYEGSEPGDYTGYLDYVSSFRHEYGDSVSYPPINFFYNIQNLRGNFYENIRFFQLFPKVVNFMNVGKDFFENYDILYYDLN